MDNLFQATNFLHTASKKQIAEFVKTFRPDPVVEILPDFLAISAIKSDDIILGKIYKLFRYSYSVEFRRYERTELKIPSFQTITYSDDGEIITVDTANVRIYSADLSLITNIDIKNVELMLARDVIIVNQMYIVLSGKRILIIYKGDLKSDALARKIRAKYNFPENIENTGEWKGLTVEHKHVVSQNAKPSKNSNYFFVYVRDQIILYSLENNILREAASTSFIYRGTPICFENDETVDLFAIIEDRSLLHFIYDKITKTYHTKSELKGTKIDAMLIKISDNHFTANRKAYSVYPFADVGKTTRKLIKKFNISPEIVVLHKIIKKNGRILQELADEIDQDKVFAIKEETEQMLKDRNKLNILIGKHVPVSRPLINIIGRFI